MFLADSGAIASSGSLAVQEVRVARPPGYRLLSTKTTALLRHSWGCAWPRWRARVLLKRLLPTMRDLILLSWMAAIVAGCGGETESSGGAPDAGADARVADAAHVDASPDASPDASTDGSTDRDAGATDAASFACGDRTCAAGDVCVRTYTTGGVCRICGDGGACAAGSHCGGQCCVVDVPSYAYACKPVPAACVGGLSCSGTCGSALCASGACPCETASGNAATCHCLAP